MNAVDHVERRESCRSESRYEAEERQDIEARYADQEQRTAQLNAACRAIQSTPFRLVDSAFIAQVLATLSAKADEANMTEVVDALDACHAEVEQ